MQQVAEARLHNEPVDLLPERTDMSANEVRDLILETSLKDVIQETKEELADELAESPGLGFAQIVDRINEELDEEGGA